MTHYMVQSGPSTALRALSDTPHRTATRALASRPDWTMKWVNSQFLWYKHSESSVGAQNCRFSKESQAVISLYSCRNLLRYHLWYTKRHG